MKTAGGWKRRLAAHIVGELPEDDEDALEVLELARAILLLPGRHQPGAGLSITDVMRIVASVANPPDGEAN